MSDINGISMEDVKRGRPIKSCYNCGRGCKLTGIADIPLMADEGQQCKFWWPSEDMFIPTETELEGMKRLEQERRVKQRGKI